MTWEGVPSYEEILAAFMQRNEFEVCYWDGREIEGYIRRLPPTYYEPFANGFLEPFVQQEYMAGTTTDLDWIATTDRMSNAMPVLVALNDDLKEQWKKEWGPRR